jgi:GcrA cell cycle regulator
MGWTDERVVVLKKLWLDGLSASQIAKQLGGGVTRNAVIGKVHRLGLSGRAAPSQPQRPAAFKPARPSRPAVPASTLAPQPLAARRPEPQPPQVVRYREEAPGSATVLTLGAKMCKWPIGDPATSGFTFCGKDCNGEGPYCFDHAEVAYQPAQKKAGRSQVADLARSLRRYM